MPANKVISIVMLASIALLAVGIGPQVAYTAGDVPDFAIPPA